MKKYNFIFIMVIIINVNAQKKPIAIKDTISGIVMYEFYGYNSSYCEMGKYIIERNKKIQFLDEAGYNYLIINSYDDLKMLINESEIYKDLYFDFLYQHDSLNINFQKERNLNFTDYKIISRAENGHDIKISSEYFYKRNDLINYIYLCFNLYAEVIRYYNVDYFKKKESNIQYDCCPLIDYKTEFIVLSKILEIKELSENQLKKIKFKKCNKKSINLRVCE